MPQFNGDVVFIDSSGVVRALQNSLHLVADSGDVVIDHPSRLLPEVDATQELGIDTKRWANIYAVSGIISNRFSAGPLLVDADLATATLVNGSFNFAEFTSVNVATNASFTVDGSAVFPGSFSVTAAVPSFTNRHFVSSVGSVVATISDIDQVRPVDSRLVSGQIIPDTDLAYPLGSLSARFVRLHASSGILNVISPPTSGTFVELAGSWLPDRNNIRALGVFTQRWGYLYAGSGDLATLTASSINTSILNFNQGDGGTITNESLIQWTAGDDITFVGSANLDFGGMNVSMDNRPTVANTSGVAMQAENYFEVYAGRNVSFANPATSMDLFTTSDNTQLTQDKFFIVNEDVQIRNISMMTTHQHTSQPSGWAVRLRLNDDTHDHASGIFTWDPNSNTSYRWFGSLSGTQTIPAGSRCRLLVDSDGTPGHATVYVKAWLGLTVVSGLQRGPQE